MNIYNEIRKLEKEEVFIDFDHEHYANGSNCCFSIEFRKNGKKIHQTGFYGDNHDFGDTADAMVASIKIAKWFLRKDNLKKYLYYNNTIETRTKKGHKKWCDGIKFMFRFHKMIDSLNKK